MIYARYSSDGQREESIEGHIRECTAFAEFMTFWLHRFCKLDVTKKEHRQMLIDAFINAIFLYDDKMLITINYKEGTNQRPSITLRTSPAKSLGTDSSVSRLFYITAN